MVEPCTLQVSKPSTFYLHSYLPSHVRFRLFLSLRTSLTRQTGLCSYRLFKTDFWTTPAFLQRIVSSVPNNCFPVPILTVSIHGCIQDSIPAAQLTIRNQIRPVIADFLVRSGYKWGTTPPNAALRARIASDVRGWDNCGAAHVVDKLVDTACSFIEAAYGHLSPEHQHYVILYTACILYSDDLGGSRLEAVRQFATRLAQGEAQLTPAFDTLAGLLKQAHEFWPPVGADSIISGTLEVITGMYIEYTTVDMEANPHAIWWPQYLRTRTGVNGPYAHFIFMKNFRTTPETYLQMLPWVFRSYMSPIANHLPARHRYIEHYIGSAK